MLFYFHVKKILISKTFLEDFGFSGSWLILHNPITPRYFFP